MLPTVGTLAGIVLVFVIGVLFPSISVQLTQTVYAGFERSP
jgi:hypothetical protein